VDIYRLTHCQLIQNDRNEEKKLGYFTNLSSINKGIEFYRTLPGFKDFPDEFYIEKFKVEGRIKENIIYEAIYYIHDDEFSVEFDKVVGLFCNQLDAKTSIDDFEVMNQLFLCSKNLVKEKIVNKYQLDQRLWTEGFQTEYI
jgi:hypothetical protein